MNEYVKLDMFDYLVDEIKSNNRIINTIIHLFNVENHVFLDLTQELVVKNNNIYLDGKRYKCINFTSELHDHYSGNVNVRFVVQRQ